MPSEWPETEEASVDDKSFDWKLRGTEKLLISDEEVVNELFDKDDSSSFAGDPVFWQLYDMKSLLLPENELSEVILIWLPMLDELLQNQIRHD